MWVLYKKAYCLNVYVTPSSSLLFVFLLLFIPIFCSWNSRVTIEIHIQLVYDRYSRVLGDNNRKIEKENYLSYAIADALQKPGIIPSLRLDLVHRRRHLDHR